MSSGDASVIAVVVRCVLAEAAVVLGDRRERSRWLVIGDDGGDSWWSTTAEKMEVD